MCEFKVFSILIINCVIKLGTPALHDIKAQPWFTVFKKPGVSMINPLRALAGERCRLRCKQTSRYIHSCAEGAES